MAKQKDLSRSSQESHFWNVVQGADLAMNSQVTPEDRESAAAAVGSDPLAESQEPPSSPDEVYRAMIDEIIRNLPSE